MGEGETAVYTLVTNHIPISDRIIGANEYETVVLQKILSLCTSHKNQGSTYGKSILGLWTKILNIMCFCKISTRLVIGINDKCVN